MKKDDIEKLFSSLDDFSKNPPEDLWQGIEEQLDYPKRRKGLAFWAVAASLVVGLGLWATFNFNTSKSSFTVPVEQGKGVVNQLKVEDATAKDKIKNTIESEKDIVESKLSDSNEATAVTKTKNTVKLNSTSNKLNNINQLVGNKKEDEVVVTTPKAVVYANNNQITKQLTPTEKSENKTFVEHNQIAEKEVKKEEQSVSDSKIKDNLSGTDLKENALAVLAKEQGKEEKKVALVQDKWSVQVFAGINNSQNLKGQKLLGSNIESQKGYNYGVKTNYKLNRRWAVGTGLKITELGQQLANVSYVNSKNMVNISKASLAAVPHEKGSYFSNPNYLFIPKSQNEKNTLATTNAFYQKGDLSQRVQYLEIPMEVSYALLNKGKTRINMNTGGFVGKAISNEVLLDNNSIGENKDVNNVVFGTLLSSTLQYELYKKTKVFIEPGMNYYTQPIQNQNFNQFQLILNFGLNVSF